MQIAVVQPAVDFILLELQALGEEGETEHHHFLDEPIINCSNVEAATTRFLRSPW
jgi:hypothetical protein